MAVQGAFIVPHPPIIISEIGRGRETEIQNTIDSFYKTADMISALAPQTIVVITPHSVMYSDYFHISPGDGAKGDFGSFGVKNVLISKKYDKEFVKNLCGLTADIGLSAGIKGEINPDLDHGVLVPLYFIERRYKNYDLVRVSVSGLSLKEHFKLGKCIAKAAERLKRPTVIIASGDLSHKLTPDGPYGFSEEGPRFDGELTNVMKTADFERFLSFDSEYEEAAAVCGLRSFCVMAGTLDQSRVSTDFMSYEGPFGVGYAVCAYLTAEKEPAENNGQAGQSTDEYVNLARLSLETYVKEGKRINVPQNLPPEMLNNKAGVFVSLKKDGKLRGCIGTISPTYDSIAHEIIENAISAGTKDPRFNPVSPEELPYLTYSVDILGKPEPISLISELDVKRYGVIVTKGFRRGLLLPNLEGVDDPTTQVSIALDKAGILQNESYKMERFEVIRHK